VEVEVEAAENMLLSLPLSITITTNIGGNFGGNSVKIIVLKPNYSHLL
jgi:hypothetical protein